MCGFVGSLGSEVSAKDIENSLRLISHRGPDGQDLIQKDRFLLACCRLAICPPYDESPLQLSAAKEVLALNGEIYNLTDLLRLSANARGQATDTSLLVHALSEQGTSILPKLRGLFAFCFSDGQRVLLARDRFGIKPIYFARFHKGLVFASEMKALLSIPGFSRDIDEDVISSFTVIGHNILPGRTPFRHVQSLMPGHFLEYSNGGEVYQKPFALVPDVPTLGDGLSIGVTEAAERAEELLSNSVCRTVLHDPQPKALFFSGGLDSSLLLDLARQHAPLTCFVLSDRGDADDLLEARRIAKTLDVPLKERWINETELAREVVNYAWHFEQPIAGGAFDLLGGVAFHALARSISKDHKVALCGEGADELFLGYHRLHMCPEVFLESIRVRLGSATSCLKEQLETYKLLGGGPQARRAVRNLALHEGLSDYHLSSVDRSGMAFGLEVRPPYLDNELAAWASSLDESVLLDRTDSWTKLPLRTIARKRFSATGTGRIAVRRKWAMPSAIQFCSEQMDEQLSSTTDHKFKMDNLLMDLFMYLHVDPGFTCCPDFSLFDFADEIHSQTRVMK